MTIQKLKKHQDQIPYSMVARDVIQSITNPDSLAIWIYLQSLPDDWQVKEDQIRSHFDIGRTRYMAAMRQLRELGLYEIVRTKDQHNNFTGCYFQIYPFPQVSKTIPTQNHTYIKENESIKEEDNIKEKDTAMVETVSLFEIFYQAYPKKVAKQAALKAWSKIKADNNLLLEIMSKLEQQKQTHSWLKDGGKYIPNPATYLNGKRWEDEVEVTQKSFNEMSATDLADYWG